MLRIPAIAVALIALSGSVQATQTVTVALPDLMGSYPTVGEEREVAVSLPVQPTAIQNVSIRLVGDSVVGALSCWVEVAGRMVEYVYEMPYSFSIYMDDPNGGYWTASGVTTENGGAFEIEDTLVGMGSPTWNFFLDGVALIRLEAHPIEGQGPGCGMLSYATATLVDVYLIVTGEFGVPTEGATWGGIKALYRRDAF